MPSHSLKVHEIKVCTFYTYLMLSVLMKYTVALEEYETAATPHNTLRMSRHHLVKYQSAKVAVLEY